MSSGQTLGVPGNAYRLVGYTHFHISISSSHGYVNYLVDH